MKIKELFTLSTGVYSIFKTYFPEKYALFYNDIETADLDNYFLYKYGEKTVVPFLENNETNLSGAVKLILNLHMAQWQKEYEVLTSDYDFLAPYKNVTVKSGSDENVAKTDDTDTNSTKGFNSDDYVGNEQNVTDGKKVTTTTYGSKIEISGNTGNKTYSELISSELEIAKTTLYSIIENDIVNDVTLSIYESEEN